MSFKYLIEKSNYRLEFIKGLYQAGGGGKSKKKN